MFQHSLCWIKYWAYKSATQRKLNSFTIAGHIKTKGINFCWCLFINVNNALPYFYSCTVGLIHFIPRLHIECGIERRKIHKRAIYAPHFRWVWVCVNLLPYCFIFSFASPYLCVRHKETLVWRKAIDPRSILSFLCHFKSILRNVDAAQVCYIFSIC